MRILAIETSCDETGIALVEGTKIEGGFAFHTLKAALLSQALLHSPYGGVYPNLAKREHEKNLPALFEQFKDEPFDAVAVTHGPGLEPALWTGVEFAKKVAAERGVPLLPTNHMEGHLISSLAQPASPETSSRGGPQNETSYVLENAKFPVLGLLISGGHTELVLNKDWFAYEIIGRTLDDAVGEAFDKVARMLGLPYPGGPEISKLAEQHRKEKTSGKWSGLAGVRGASPDEEIRGPFPEVFSWSLPRPMLNSGTCDFSFSGLKTAALYALRDRGGIQTLSADEIAAFAAELEDAIAEVLTSKTRHALQDTGAQTFVIGGGVAANRYIRERLEKMILDEFPDVEFRLPHLAITGDNAVMIAHAALARSLSGIENNIPPAEVRAVGNLSLAS